MKHGALVIISLLILFQALGQGEKKDNPDFLLVSFDYASNTNTFGVTLTDVKQPNYLFTTSYISKYNFDITYAGIITDNADSTFSKPAGEHNLGIGYSFDISKSITIYPGYTHLVHSENSYALKSAFHDILQVDTYYSSQHFNSSFTLSYLFGNKNMLYSSLQNALELSIDKFLHKNGLLNIQLGFNINLSDKNYYNKEILDNYDGIELRNAILKQYPIWGFKILQRFDNEDFNQLKDWYYNNNTELFEPDYKITTVDFYLPIYYSINKVMLSFSTYITIPTITNKFYKQYTTLQITTGISYFFD